MAFIAGLNAAPVFRLTHTKEEAGRALQQAWQSLEQLMASAGAFKAYRATLKNANPPAIPYMYSIPSSFPYSLSLM